MINFHLCSDSNESWIRKGNKIMRKNSIIKVVCLSFIMSVILTACNIPGVTVPFDGSEEQRKNDGSNGTQIENSKNNIEVESDAGIKAKEITDNIDEAHYTLKKIPQDKIIYHVGDVVSPVGVVDANGNTGAYVHFKIKSAKVYEHVSEAQVDISKISEAWELFDGESGYKTMAYKNEKSMEAKFLLCDIDMEYEKSYLKWLDFDNITKLSLIYVQEDGGYVMTGYPIYLSNRDNSKPEYQQNDYDIHEGIVNLQVGWVIDKELFGVELFDLSKLYICTAADGNKKFQEFIDLELDGNEED